MGVLGNLLGVLGYLLGVPEKTGIDDWTSRCNSPPSGGKLHHPIFSDGLGIDDRASMIGHR